MKFLTDFYNNNYIDELVDPTGSFDVVSNTTEWCFHIDKFEYGHKGTFDFSNIGSVYIDDYLESKLIENLKFRTKSFVEELFQEILFNHFSMIETNDSQFFKALSQKDKIYLEVYYEENQVSNTVINIYQSDGNVVAFSGTLRNIKQRLLDVFHKNDSFQKKIDNTISKVFQNELSEEVVTEIRI